MDDSITAIIVLMTFIVSFSIFFGSYIQTDLNCAEPYKIILKSNIQQYERCMESNFPYLPNPLQKTGD